MKSRLSSSPVMIPAEDGRLATKIPRRVCVVGGGIAGLSAATILAERGVQVTLHERESYWGGRAGSWSDTLKDGTPFQMERGFHAFFRQYYNLRRLMARVVDRDSALMPLTDYPLCGPNGAQESFSDLPRRAPFNLITLLQRSESFAWRDLLKMNHDKARLMLSYDRNTTYARYDEVTAQAYLDSLGFPDHARRMLFDVFAHSFFNPENEFSAAELMMMFHYYFLGNPEGLVFDVLKKPFGPGLWEPLASYLEDRGAQLKLQSSVAQITHADSKWTVTASSGTETFDALVLAVTPRPLQRLWSKSRGVDSPDFARQIDSLQNTHPFAVWRLWLDGKVNADRPPFAGTTGLGLLDNVSCYEQFEDESTTWSERTGGSVIELHAYAVPPHLDAAEIKDDLLRGLHGLYPETANLQTLEDRFLLRDDCPSFAPGSDALRPAVDTPWPTLRLAGDFVKLPFPSALMERAATSGMMAANGLLKRWGLRTEALWTIKKRGLLAPLRKVPSSLSRASAS